ncbi:alpha/beta hydrolase [Alkalilimnicola sp. S0819]|uniref:alpha/beta hydrolase n=1 Tax=Alkalilimnicola sp. S0819 TaxID=2613922 RepID=UPI0012624E0E|nr:alpha/beta fold hydrolase [Alkalilimnicola sp. S0819]KAB7622703.1 carboxylesterase [Alkalilimnicola sp. S0819]MPQ17342.1 carboxylesterase [Alkalilimnicola sp. S0819]
MSDSLLETVEFGPENAGASVIWLHGLGADGHDFEPVLPALGDGATRGVRFVFPHAPVRPVTVNGGMAMRAWFDISELGGKSPVDEAGIEQSTAQVRALIAREVDRGVPSHAIVLAGFSQGGAVVLHAALRHPERLAGVMGLSTYMPLAERLAADAHPANAELPVFLAHGEQDDVLPFSLGERSREALQAQGYPVEWHAYPMGHQLCMEEAEAIGAWLMRVLGGAA